MSKKKLVSSMLAALLLVGVMPQPVQAAQALAIQGREYVPSEAGEVLDAYAESLPESVVKAYLASGGTLSVTPYLIVDWADGSVNGLYDIGTKDIRLRYDKNQADTEIGKTLLHEIGHFVYYSTIDQWPDEMREQFASKKESLITAGGGHLSDVEAFAFLYSSCYSDGSGAINCKDFLKAVEDLLIPKGSTAESDQRSVRGMGHSFHMARGK